MGCYSCDEYAKSFCQNISVWGVTEATITREMFVGTLLEECLLSLLSTSFFYEGDYAKMCKSSQERLFTRAFRWNRRKSFVMFLAGQGYLPSVGTSRDVDSCAALFDVEDMYRLICACL